MSNPEGLARFRKLCPNTLDVVEEKYGEIRAVFYATEDDRSNKMPTVLLVVEGGLAKVGSSMCLPTYDWTPYADAYARAASFFRRANLTEARPY